MRLAEKIKAGTATAAEIERFENRPVVFTTSGGAVQITAPPPMTPEQWKAAIPRINAAEQERAAERRKSIDPSA